MGVSSIKMWKVLAFLGLVGLGVAEIPEYCVQNDFFTPSTNQYIIPVISTPLGSLFDGPASISAASTSTTNQDYTVPELMYYNYFAASTYCPYTLPDLSCCYCQHFRETVTNYTVFEDAGNGTKALVTLHPSRSEIVVAFRGSVALMNWLMDVYFLNVDSGSGIKLHRGIFLQTMSLYNQITEYVSALRDQNPGFKITITGHSLGGGMASMYTFFLKYLNQFPGTELGLISLGSPRVGNKAFADYMNSLGIKMARVVARGDLIPHFNPVNAFGLAPVTPVYLHHMREVWINGTSSIFCSTIKYEDPTCSNSMGPAYSFPDHNGYFDADLGRCLIVEGYVYADLVTLPNGWNPTDVIPRMPSKMYKDGTGLWTGGYSALGPAIG